MSKGKIFNVIFFMIVAYVVYLKSPSILTNFKFQDQKASDFTLRTLEQGSFNLSTNQKKLVVVFWATWCGPCEVELGRINKMIMERKIQPSDVLAISSYEEESVIRQTAKSKNYLFPIGIDRNGQVSSAYKVSATPTVVFLDQSNTIHWMTAGMSPTLEFRISSFLK